MKLPLKRVAEFTFASGEFDARAVAQGYSIDSRTIAPGELFFAVKGERLDGHDYVESALQKGAVGAVVARSQLTRFPVMSGLLAVDDTLVALQSLATAVRRLWGKKLIAVTGSAGKTTTKELIAHLLAAKFRVLKSEGNLNNHFGLPLQLLRLEPEHDIAVMEMGMSHAGEITALARIAHPEIGVVTNVAPVHLGFFRSIADIARAKYELISGLPAGGTAVLNADDAYVSQFGRDFHGNVLMYGIEHPADVRAQNISSQGIEGENFDLLTDQGRTPAHLPLLGKHNIYNALAALAVALQEGAPVSDAVAALAKTAPPDKRGQVIRAKGVTVINDCYNSNPKALDGMVDALAQLPAKRRIVVAGEMLELGDAGEHLHRASGQHIAGSKIDVLIGVRGLAQYMVEEAGKAGIEAHFVAAPEDAGQWLKRQTRKGDAVLLKASRGVKLEHALEVWGLGRPSSTQILKGKKRAKPRKGKR
jgi:UDP-N-acetylmuramoyl-tripeptide--D-alanyl-D-alanine ligase